MFFILKKIKKNEKKFGTFKKACIFVSNKNKYYDLLSRNTRTIRERTNDYE